MEKQIDLPDYHELFHKKLTNITEYYRYHPGVKNALKSIEKKLPDAQAAYLGLIEYINFGIEEIIKDPAVEIDIMFRYLSTLVRKYERKIDLSGDKTIVQEYCVLTQRWGEIIQNTTPTQAHIREMEKRLFDFYKEYVVGSLMN